MEKISNTQVARNPSYSMALIIMSLASPLTVFGIMNLTIFLGSPIIFSLIFILTVIYAWCLWIIYNYSSAFMSQGNDMAFQVKAFNDHSLVTIADNENKVTYVNENFLRTTGFQTEDLLGFPTSSFFPESEILLNNEISDAVLRGENWVGETLIISKDNQEIWTRVTAVPRINQHGVMVGSIAIRTDITESKIATAEKNLRRSLHILRDEVYMYETESLRYIYLNKAAMERHGWDEATYKQKTIMDRGKHKIYNVDAFYERVAPLIKDNAKEVEYELLVDGCIHEVKTQLVQPEGGKPHFISIERDISERHVFERTKNDFISTVSHELRTPVTSIKGAIAMVLSGATGELSTKSKGMLDIAHRNADRLSFLVNDILDLEKIAAGHMEYDCQTINISQLILDTISANEAYASNFDVTYVTVGIDQAIECYCDSDRIFQVMNNLLSNAAKFSNVGDDVIVTLSQHDEIISISVEDFGVGIPLEAQSSIFDRFAQVDSSDQRARQGTGLGLSIAKALVEGQNGEIYFESKLGKGTKFSFDLPKKKK